MESYDAFLRSKVVLADKEGFDCEAAESQMSMPSLFDFEQLDAMQPAEAA